MFDKKDKEFMFLNESNIDELIVDVERAIIKIISYKQHFSKEGYEFFKKKLLESLK